MELKKKIKKIRSSIIAIGFKPSPDKITIIGTGFAVSNSGQILSATHLCKNLNSEQEASLIGAVMTKQEDNGLEHYTWLPLKKVKTDEKNDIALFQINEFNNTLLKPLELDDSEKIEVGDDVYFVGFPYAAQLINDGFGMTLIVNKTIISNVKRDGINPNHPKNWFIVDAISNPGNSGCPLISMETNKVIGIMTISFRAKSQIQPTLDIREPMHIAGAKPINLAKDLINK